MRKKIALISMLILIILIIAGIFAFNNKVFSDGSFSFSKDVNVKVESGRVEPESLSMDFTVTESGINKIYLSWLPKGKTIEEAMKLPVSELPFVTGCVISSDDDPCVYATTGGWLTIAPEINMEAGNYRIDYYYLANEEDFTEFGNKYFGTVEAQKISSQIEWDQLKKDGNLEISYQTEINSKGTPTTESLILFAVTILLFALIFILVNFIISGGKMDKFRFDERQEALRGKGSRMAFLAMMFYMIWIYMIDALGLVSEEFDTLLYMAGIILGVVIYAVYAIWHDCYFALNESKKSRIWIMVVVGVSNLIIGIFGLRDILEASRNNPYGLQGVSKTPLLGLAVAVMLIAITVTMALKRAKDKKSKDEEGEEDEEEALN